MNRKLPTHLSEEAFETLWNTPLKKLSFIFQVLDFRYVVHNNREFMKVDLSNGFFVHEAFIHPDIDKIFHDQINKLDVVEATMSKKDGQSLILVTVVVKLIGDLKEIVGQPIEFQPNRKNPAGSNLITELQKPGAANKVLAQNDIPNHERYFLNDDDEHENDQFINFNSLGVMDKSIKIKARLISRGDVKNFIKKDGKASSLFNVILFDGEVEVQGTFFDKAPIYSELEEGQIYVFTDVDVRAADKFNKTQFKYQLVFGNNCKIKKCKDDNSITKNNFKFKTIQEIQDLPNKTTVDVMVIIDDPGQVKAIALKTGEFKDKRNVTVHDDSGFSISLTIWGEEASNFKLKKGEIVIFAKVQVHDYKGKTLSFSWDSKLVTKIPAGPRYEQMVFFMSKNKNVELISSSNFVQREKKLVFIQEIIDECKSITDADKKTKYFSFTGTIFGGFGMPYYDGCKNEDCQKKAISEGDRWKCPKCDIYFAQPVPKFFARLIIKDISNSIVVVLSGGDQNCNKLFGMSVKELKDRIESSPVKEPFRNVMFATYLFNIYAKPETFNDNFRVNYHCTTFEEMKGENSVIKVNHLLNFVQSMSSSANGKDQNDTQGNLYTGTTRDQQSENLRENMPRGGNHQPEEFYRNDNNGDLRDKGNQQYGNQGRR